MRPIRALLVPLLAALACPLMPGAEKDGLIAEYFDGTTQYPSKLSGKKPTLVRVEKQVNFAEVTGQFYKTKLAENFSARFSGIIKVEQAGSYEFSTESDDGSLLTINGKVVADNSGEHGMTKKSGTIELTAGSHELVLEYQQGTGGAGCKLFWKQPNGKGGVIPKESLFHDPAKLKAISWDEAAFAKRKGGGGSGKFVDMDHGPYYTGTVMLGGGQEAVKGITLRLDAEKSAYACFDPESLALRFAGTEIGLAHPSGRDGLEGQVGLEGESAVRVAAIGWAKPGSNDFTDPRPKKRGNIPADWAKYRGLYLDGQAVILSYSVGKAGVLELDAFEQGAITRSFTLSGNDDALALLVHEGTATLADGIAVSEDGENVSAVAAIAGTLSAADGKVVLAVPAKTALAKVAIWRGPKADLAKFTAAVKAIAKPTDLTSRTKGGKPRWNETVVTAGELGKPKGNEAYVVDTLTIPYENPWKCYMRTTGVDFFKDGRIAVSTIDGDVWIVTPGDADLSKLTWKRYASGMFQTLGLRIVDEKIYITNRDRLIRLHDLNNDGEADFYENFNGDCEVERHYHEFTLGLETDGEGNFVFNKGSNLNNSPNSAATAHQGCVLKVSKDGSTLSVYATGLRAPNGLGGGDGLPLTNSDNEGNWVPASRVNLIKADGFYGFKGTAHGSPKIDNYDPPIAWLPRPLDNSSGGQVWVTSDKWGPLKGSLLHMSYGQSSLFVMPFEEIDGVPQGGVVRFPLNFQSSCMRARFSKLDGQLYLVGMRGWQTNAGKEGALQRVRYTGKPVTLPHKLNVTAKGVTITFPVALDADTAGDKDSYAVERWNYRYTSNYGSKDYKLSNPEEVGHDKVDVTSVTLSADKKSVTIAIADLKQVMQQGIKYKIATADGEAISGELFHTINVAPK